MKYSIPIILMTLSLAACGGSAKGPQPLKLHVDEAALAPVAVAERAHEFEAQREYETAKMELAKAKFDLETLKTDLKVANNEVKQAKLDAKSASQREAAAKKSNDMNRVNAETAAHQAAKVGIKTAKARVVYMKAEQSYLKKYVQYSMENFYAAEARWELSQAKTAKDHRIAPRGFNYASIEQQSKERNSRVQKRKLVADKARKKAADKKKALKQDGIDPASK